MKKWLVAAMAAVVALLTQAAIAHDKCSRCGCASNIRKVCKAVPETKKLKETKWECKCEEICIPGRTQTHDCQPTCGRVRCVTKLIKKETTKEVQTFKWVIETVCGDCCDSGGLLHHSGGILHHSGTNHAVETVPVIASEKQMIKVR